MYKYYFNGNLEKLGVAIVLGISHAYAHDHINEINNT